jgi:hypothetical protein
VIGFSPTYFVAMMLGRFKAEPIVHIHGMIVFSWVTVFCLQTWLVANGKTLAHVRIGWSGFSRAIGAPRL